jgi:hypothetical protein
VPVLLRRPAVRVGSRYRASCGRPASGCNDCWRGLRIVGRSGRTCQQGLEESPGRSVWALTRFSPGGWGEETWHLCFHLTLTAPCMGGRTRRGLIGSGGPVCCPRWEDSYLVDPASSHMLVSKIKPCMSKYNCLYWETANGSLNQL